MLTFICLIVAIVIVLFIIAIAVMIIFPGPSVYFPPPPPPPYHQKPYDTPYTQRQYPPPATTQIESQQQAKEKPIAYCRGCGKQIPSDSKFCQYCGLGQSSTTPKP